MLDRNQKIKKVFKAFSILVVLNQQPEEGLQFDDSTSESGDE